MTLPGMWGVERFGRRRLLLVGAVGMCICEYLVAIIGVTISVQNQAGQKALIALVCIYIAFFASTWGPIAWVVTGEIFPLNVRAKAMSMSTASNWLWNFGIGYASACHVYFLISVDADFFFAFHQRLTSSTLVQATQTSVSRCSSFGERLASAASSSPTSAFLRYVLSCYSVALLSV